ncbi:MAG: hypothetical protein KF721_14365 [Ignavibacteriaceae bacterium]|nr:hypothetical protein [Ignavibacteriaceae bacterium]
MRYFVAVIFVLNLFIGCSKDENNPTSPVKDTPSVKIVSPINNQNVLDSITIQIDASDTKGITKVELYIQNLMVKEFAIKPYNYFWDVKSLPDSSQYSIYAKAYNSDDKVTGSEVIIVTTNRLSPSNLELLSLSKDSVYLKWKDNSTVEESYIIQVSTDSVNFNSIAELPANTTEARISYSFSFGVKYAFRVGAKKNTRISFSNVFSIVNFCPSTITHLGKTYNTVQIGNQCWLRENLNVGTRINGSQEQTNNSTLEKYCYNDLESNCDIYGGLYQWNEAMQYSRTAGAKGICPEGWHIPTNAEFQTLKAAVANNSNSLKAIGEGIGDGAGTNTSGFSALLAGYRHGNGSFDDVGNNAYFWCSSESNATSAYFLRLSSNDSYISFFYYYKNNGFSVRCLQD